MLFNYSKNKFIIMSIILLLIYLFIFYIWFFSYSIIQPIDSFVENWKLVEIYSDAYYASIIYYKSIFILIILLNFILIKIFKHNYKLISLISIFIFLLTTLLFIFIV